MLTAVLVVVFAVVAVAASELVRMQCGRMLRNPVRVSPASRIGPVPAPAARLDPVQSR
jgi:hypothetical protein